MPWSALASHLTLKSGPSFKPRYDWVPIACLRVS